MELKYSQLSPYGRKVTVVIHEIGIADRVRLTRVDARNDPDSVTPFNPLGKIPALVTDGGAVIVDSPVICEFLDAEYGDHRLLPATGARRWEIGTRTALADGMIDASILIRHERARVESKRSDEWIAWQLRKVEGAMAYFESVVGTFGDSLDLGQVALGAALGYMPLRLDELAGLARWPALRAWYAKVSERESFRLTAPAT